MGSYDRDYMRDDWRGKGSRGTWAGVEPVVWIFMGVSVIMFLMPNLTGWGYDETAVEGPNGQVMELASRAGHYSSSGLQRGEIWRLVTYQFVHADMLHVLINMVMLYFMGRIVARELGAAQFALIYLAGGTAGALFETLLNGIVREPTRIVGASASIAALFFVVVALMPKANIRLFPFPMAFPIKKLAWAYLLVQAVLGLATLKTDAGHAAYLAHLGGSLYGLLHGRYFLSRIVLPGFPTPASLKKRKTKAPRVKYRSRAEQPNVIDAQFTNGSADYNAVLDKINREGMGSLTPAERKILEQASESLAKKKS